MCAATRQVSAELSALSEHFDAGDLSEALALLAWMEDRHFTFLGYREYRLQGRKGQEALRPVEATGLGILRRGHRQPTSSNRSLARDIRRQSRSRDIVLVTKANLVSTVHRSGHLDYVGIKHFDAKGRLIGEKRFLGLWTSSAYSTNPREIPVLRRKVAQVVEHFALAPDSHDGRRCCTFLNPFRAMNSSGQCDGFDSHRHRRVRPAGAPAGPPAAAARCISPVLFLSGVRAARKIQHPGSPADRKSDP
jgi:glutamate dehydrogenase